MGKGPQRYSKETIQSAIQKLEDGASLSAIAREIGIPKTTIKYWIDNANKFLGDEHGDNLNSKVSRVQNQILDYGWRLLFKLYKRIQTKMPDAAFRDLVYAASELQGRLTQIRTLHGSVSGETPSVMEVSEETKVTVRTFLEKKKAKETPTVTGEDDLGNPGLDHGQAPLLTAAIVDNTLTPTAENKANG